MRSWAQSTYPSPITQNLESLASNASGSPAGQITEMSRRATADRARYTQELMQFKEELEQLKSEKAIVSQKLDERDASISMLVDADKDEVSGSVQTVEPRS